VVAVRTPGLRHRDLVEEGEVHRHGALPGLDEGSGLPGQ
jgi:hypothetical protein